jgi:predicted dehydrogenase
MSQRWKIAVLKDSSKPMLGGHGLQVAFRGLPGVEMVALVDSNRDHLDFKLAQTGAARHYTDYATMLEKEKPDIVILCSRHPADHFEQASLAMKQGCHVFCEKPVSVLLPEADAMVRLADECGVKFGMAHPARHDAGYRTMKRLLEGGEIGTPLTVIGRGKCDHRGGGEDLIVLGTHILDLMVYFFGSPQSVAAEVFTEGRPATRYDVAQKKLVEPVGPALGDEIFARFRFANGVQGIFESRRGLFNWQDPSFDHERGVRHMGLSVIGTQGVLSLRFDDLRVGHEPLLISRQTGFPDAGSSFEEVPLVEDRVIPGAAPLDDSLCGQPDVPRPRWFREAGRFAAWDLICAIEENRPPLSGIHDARIVVEMIQGLYASHLSRSTMAFPLKNREHPLAAC